MKWTLISGLTLAMVGGVAIPATFPSQNETLERLLQIDDQRLVGDADLDSALLSTDPIVNKAALRVVAHFGEPRYRNAIVHGLQNKSGTVRAEAAFAAGQLADATLLADLSTTLTAEDDFAAQRELLMAIGRLGSQDAQTALEMQWAKSSNTAVRAAIANALALVFVNPASATWPLAPESLTAIFAAAQSTDHELAVNAGFALKQYRGPLTTTDREAEIAWENISVPDARAYAARFLGRFPTQNNALWMAYRITMPNEIDSVRVELLRALAKFPASVSRDVGVCYAVDRPSNVVSEAALEIMETTVTEAYDRCGRSAVALAQRSPSVWVKSQAFATIITLDKAQRYAFFEQGATSRDLSLARTVLSHVGKMTDPRARGVAMKAIQEADATMVGPLLDSMQDFPVEWLTTDFKQAIIKRLEGHDFVMTASAMDLAIKFKWTEFVPVALSTLQYQWPEDQYDAYNGALRLLGKLGGMQHLSAIEPFLNHPNRFVIETAVASYQEISGTAPREVPINHPKITTKTPSWETIQGALKKHIVLETAAGVIELEAFGEAPLTYTSFVALANKGFFNGTNFHRVVSHFVAQGGDPRGDGSGGPGFLIRDEVSPESHMRGTVGLATAGKDTGGSQLFFNLDPNKHLDGHYTLFARVVQGMPAMDKIEVGTKILRAYVK